MTDPLQSPSDATQATLIWECPDCGYLASADADGFDGKCAFCPTDLVAKEYVDESGRVVAEVHSDVTELLDEPTVNDCVPQPDGSLVVWADDCGPAPNAVDVFADHTDAYTVTELDTHAGNGKGYVIREVGE